MSNEIKPKVVWSIKIYSVVFMQDREYVYFYIEKLIDQGRAAVRALGYEPVESRLNRKSSLDMPLTDFVTLEVLGVAMSESVGFDANGSEVYRGRLPVVRKLF